MLLINCLFHALSPGDRLKVHRREIFCRVFDMTTIHLSSGACCLLHFTKTPQLKKIFKVLGHPSLSETAPVEVFFSSYALTIGGYLKLMGPMKTVQKDASLQLFVKLALMFKLFAAVRFFPAPTGALEDSLGRWLGRRKIPLASTETSENFMGRRLRRWKNFVGAD